MLDLIYIASPSYSGSTLLTFLLNTHPDVATVGELKWGAIHLDTYRCSCGQLLRECGFWKQVQEGLAADGFQFDLQRPPTDFRFRTRAMADRLVRARIRGPVFESVRKAAITCLPAARTDWRIIADINRQTMRRVIKLSGAPTFLDGSKEPIRLKHLVETGDYNAWCIQLVRDGRGVVNSSIKNKGLSVEVSTTEWRDTHRQIERLAEVLGPGRLIRVRYEDLCLDLDATWRRLLDSLAMQQRPVIRNYRSVEHHILGNSMRLRPETDIAMDEKWRTMLSAGDLETFDRLAGDMNRRYGYT